jgi:hypothetical protein
MAELIRRFITSSGSVYLQTNQVGGNGKVTFKSWKRSFKNGHKIDVREIKEAVYISVDDYKKILKDCKGKEKSRLVELARLGDYHGDNGVIWFLDKNDEIYTSSLVQKIEPPYITKSSIKKEIKKNYDGGDTPKISDEDLVNILVAKDDKKELPKKGKKPGDDLEFKIED